jgi:VanZ family protein
MNRKTFIRFTPGIAWFIIVMVLLFAPGNEFPSTKWFGDIQLDKVVHAGVFGLMGLLFMLPIGIADIETSKKLAYFIRIAIAVSVWGLASEFIQKYWAVGRNFDLIDCLADSIGAAIAFLYCKKKYIKSS